MRTINLLSLFLITIFGVASAQAGTVHAGHTTVHSGGHGNYQGDNGYYAHGGQGYYANGRQRYYTNGGAQRPLWRGGYYGGQYYDSGYYPYNSAFFLGLPIPVPFFFPGFN